ncbi:MAG: hypothetical protein ACR2RA_17220 [Geminicoccaceae bacterium]
MAATAAATGSRTASALPDEAAPAVGRLPEEKAALIADRLLHAYPLRRSHAVIGGVFWREAASQARGCQVCLEALIEDFLLHLGLSEASFGRMPPAAIRDHVSSGNMLDFSMGRIVSVRGWILGETEARLCAIAALRDA